jgi:hypothetical protein
MPTSDFLGPFACMYDWPAVRAITIAEVPLQAADDALAQRYHGILESCQPIALDVDIAESAARLRAQAGGRDSSGERAGNQRRCHGDA